MVNLSPKWSKRKLYSWKTKNNQWNYFSGGLDSSINHRNVDTVNTSYSMFIVLHIISTNCTLSTFAHLHVSKQAVSQFLPVFVGAHFSSNLSFIELQNFKLKHIASLSFFHFQVWRQVLAQIFWVFEVLLNLRLLSTQIVEQAWV